MKLRRAAVAKAAAPAAAGRGLGLIGIRERVEALGGVFELKSEIGAGVTLAISVPIDGEVNESDQSFAG